MSEERKYYCLCADNCKFETMTKEQILAAIAQATGIADIDPNAAFISKIKERNAGGYVTFWVGTQAQYNSLETIESTCLYIITDDTGDEDINKAIEEAKAVAAAAQKNALAALPKSGGMMSGNINMGDNRITNLGFPQNNWDAAVYAQLLETDGYIGYYAEAANEAGINSLLSTLISIAVQNQSCMKSFSVKMTGVLPGFTLEMDAVGTVYCPTADYGYAVFRFYNINDPAVYYATKACYNGTWQSFAWVNPPMNVGYEYRTTEQFMGYPVYAKVVSLGAVPNTALKTVSSCYSDAIYAISCSGIAYDASGYQLSIPTFDNAGKGIAMWAYKNGNIVISSNYNASAYTNSYALVKYTKQVTT